MTWTLIAWNVVFVVLAVAPFLIEWCDMPYGSERTACAMGTGFYLVLLYASGFVAWAVGNVVLAIIWLATRPKRGRPAPSKAGWTDQV